MSAEVTLTLTDTLFERAQLWAQHSGRPVDEFLTEAIELSLSPLGDAPKPVESWTDDEVRSGCKSQMDDADDERLSELLEKQRESQLTETDATGLRRLMFVYQEGLLRKAMATREAVWRGLREPFAS
jgi:hypothetical protein